MRLTDDALDALFRSARSYHGWTADPVTDDDIRAIYEVMKWGPTSANCSPARFLFLRTPEAKEKLAPALSRGNQAQIASAPVVVIAAYDPRFFDRLPELYKRADARAWYADNPPLAEETALRNATLQGAYFVVAARALGFDVCPMSGFDRGRVDHDFLAEEGWRSNFLIVLGHGDPAGLRPRDTRLAFEDACALL